LVYATYLGGAYLDAAYGVAVDARGSCYVCGHTNSLDFPKRNAAQSLGFIVELHPVGEMVVTEDVPSGAFLAYSTYLGGAWIDEAYAVAVDATGACYVTGRTQSQDFPVKNAYQTDYGGGGSDAVVAKLAPAGFPVSYATYLGGTSAEYGLAIAVDA